MDAMKEIIIMDRVSKSQCLTAHSLEMMRDEPLFVTVDWRQKRGALDNRLWLNLTKFFFLNWLGSGTKRDK